MAKTALVISGGGSRGAFAVGVVKYLFNQRPDIQFDIICGTSTGSLMAPLIATGEINALEALYTNQRTENIIRTGNLVQRFINNNSLFDATPLADLIKSTYTPERYEALMRSGKEVLFTTVCLQTGNIVYFSTEDIPIPKEYEIIKLADRDEMIRAILASACQPVFMPPIEIRSSPAAIRQYVDGGVREHAPIQLAIDQGATDVYAIIMSPEFSEPDDKRYTNVMDMLLRTVDLFTDDVSTNDVKIPDYYNKAVNYLEAVKARISQELGLDRPKVDQLFDLPNSPFAGKRQINLHIIRPLAPLPGGVGGLEFDPEVMREMVALGETTAKNYFSPPV